jgi:hypothetical protein
MLLGVLYTMLKSENSNSNKLYICVGLAFILYHHQPINVPTAGAQAFLIDCPQGERAITHHVGPVRIGGWFHIIY